MPEMLARLRDNFKNAQGEIRGRGSYASSYEDSAASVPRVFTLNPMNAFIIFSVCSLNKSCNGFAHQKPHIPHNMYLIFAGH